MKVLITGATGFVGRNFVNVLVGKPDTPRMVCLVRSPERGEVLKSLPKPVEVYQGDIRQPETLTGLPTDFDLVFHLASLVGLKNGPQYQPVNVAGTKNLLEALQQQTQLKRLVYLSSIQAVDRPDSANPPYKPLTENDPPSPQTDYGKSKLAAERLVANSGLPYTILRPAFIYGPYPRLESRVHRAILDVYDCNPYTTLPFPGKVSEIYAEDLGDLMWHAALSPACENHTYFAANQEPLPVRSFFKEAHRLLHDEFKSNLLGGLALPFVKSMMEKKDVEPLFIDALFSTYFTCDPGRLYRDVGRMAYHGFEDGLARTLQWYRQRGMFTD